MIGLKRCFFLVLMVLAAGCRQKEVLRTIPVDDFFKSQDKIGYRLSPDGKNLSYLKLQGQDQNIYIEDIETGRGKNITRLKDKKIVFYFWVSNHELIYYKEVDAASRQSDVFIIDKEGKNERQLVNNEKSRLKVIEDQLIDDKYLLVSSNKRDSTVFDVYRLNVRNGQMEMAAKNPGNIIDWRTDAEGKLRLAISSDGVNSTILYRANENQQFKKVLTSNFKDTFYPVAFSHERPNVIYAISDVNRDKTALVEVDCNTGKEIKNIFCNDSLNITDAQYSKKNQRISFVVYETWKKEKHYLDDSVRQVYSNLDKLLPKTETRIFDKDKAETVFILRTFTDRNPGSYYLYFATTGKLRKLSDFNASIHESELCEMKPVVYTSRDGLKIHGYLTLPLNVKAENLPVVVLPHDGPGQRNLWGYNPEVQFLANRGYAVFQINYRGSSGYGKTFVAAGFKEWGGKIQDDIYDGVKWLIDRKIADPKRVGIYGTGFGGYIALNGLYLNKGTYSCAASNSGVINLFTYLKSIPPYQKPNLQMYYEIIGNPLTDIDKIRKVSPLFQVDKINAPVLLAENIKDPNNNSGEAIQFVKNLKKRNVSVTYLENDGDINIYYARNPEGRRKFYDALEEFLEVNLKRK
ncbi:prolyl oligopeptidase family serine peptidase [Pedobacter heparinus]|uniref:Peptidase S9 prolyl oligopeptidase active site domain protein n=1 Tax=Pedobacter heparinus (strain ATCC 13125 / DSM 2366 / CIP 104194 / JCM 7457 / NBRC 12017 / NCIMB 9290 / NRRL B-14731 / HIM 762-3) TaxID=485917 RepID=C6XZA7_PEDHD|nr:prolyl oligopeptidase family serine peptidase [Pedobacter heparinus]ACU02589.1 peptidase S9 prolyl oligopeptidase active site domain protein [Pedobacter heparinus DSM 2366]